MFVNSDFSDLLRLFNANQVRYLVIGGYALIQYYSHNAACGRSRIVGHGSARIDTDIDQK